MVVFDSPGSNTLGVLQKRAKRALRAPYVDRYEETTGDLELDDANSTNGPNVQDLTNDIPTSQIARKLYFVSKEEEKIIDEQVQNVEIKNPAMKTVFWEDAELEYDDDMSTNDLVSQMRSVGGNMKNVVTMITTPKAGSGMSKVTFPSLKRNFGHGSAYSNKSSRNSNRKLKRVSSQIVDQTRNTLKKRYSRLKWNLSNNKNAGISGNSSSSDNEISELENSTGGGKATLSTSDIKSKFPKTTTSQSSSSSSTMGSASGSSASSSTTKSKFFDGSYSSTSKKGFKSLSDQKRLKRRSELTRRIERLGSMDAEIA